MYSWYIRQRKYDDSLQHVSALDSPGLWCKYIITGLMIVMLHEMAAGQGNRFVKWSVGGTMLFVAAIRCFIAQLNWLIFFNNSDGSVVQAGCFWQACRLRWREYLAAQGQPYMLACKSCWPKLSWEQQSSESLWFWKDKCICYFAYLKLNLTAVLQPCVFVEVV